MKVQYKGTEYDVKLKTSFVNYNCSTKMVGRLELVGTLPNVTTGYKWDQVWLAALDAIKKDLIHDWVRSLDVKTTFPKLCEGNPIFPQDHGQYLPSILLFSDAVNGYAGTHWTQSFLGLLRELESGPYGCIVVGLPAYHNRTYGVYGAPRLSRVWAIYPPSMRSFVFTPHNSELEARFKDPKIFPLFKGKEREDLELAAS